MSPLTLLHTISNRRLPAQTAKRKTIALLIGTLVFVSPSTTYADSLITQRAHHSVQLLDNIRAGSLAYYAKNHDWPITSSTPTNLDILVNENYVSGLSSHYTSSSGITMLEPVTAYVDPNSHALVLLLNLLEPDPSDNIYAERLITDNIISRAETVGSTRRIKVIIPPPPAASTATTQLSRVSVPGNPDLNKMETHIDMSSPAGVKHDIKSVNNLDSQTLKVGNVASATNIPANTPHTFAVFGTSVFSDKASFGDGTATGSVNHTLTNPVNVEIQHAAVIDEISAGVIGVDDLTVYKNTEFADGSIIDFGENTQTTFKTGSTVHLHGSTLSLDSSATVANNATNNNTGATNFSTSAGVLNFNNQSSLNLNQNSNMTVGNNASVQHMPGSTLTLQGTNNIQGTTNFEAGSVTTLDPASTLNLNGTVNYSGSGTTTFGPLGTVNHGGVVNHGGTTTFANGGQTNFKGDTNFTGANINIDYFTDVDVYGDTHYKAMSDTTFENKARVTFLPGSVVRFDSNVDFDGGITIDDVNDIKLASGGTFMDEVKKATATNNQVKAKPAPSGIYYFNNGSLKMGSCQDFDHKLEDGIYNVEYRVDEFGTHEEKSTSLFIFNGKLIQRDINSM